MKYRFLRFPEGKTKAITLSYDDGSSSDKRVAETLTRYGLKGTFNINTGRYLPEDAQRETYFGRMKLSEAQALFQNSPHEVAVHSLTHPFLGEDPRPSSFCLLTHRIPHGHPVCIVSPLCSGLSLP